MEEIKTIRAQLRNLGYYRKELELIAKSATQIEGNRVAKEIAMRTDGLLRQIADHAQVLSNRREDLDAQQDQQAEAGVVREGRGPEEARPEPGGEEEGVPDVPPPVPPRTDSVPSPSIDPSEDEGRAKRQKEKRK